MNLFKTVYQALDRIYATFWYGLTYDLFNVASHEHMGMHLEPTIIIIWTRLVCLDWTRHQSISTIYFTIA